MKITPNYDRAIRSVRACERWSREGFPGASYEDLIRIANDTQPEELLIHIRQRAEREFKETIDQLRAQVRLGNMGFTTVLEEIQD